MTWIWLSDVLIIKWKVGNISLYGLYCSYTVRCKQFDRLFQQQQDFLFEMQKANSDLFASETF